MDGRDYLVKGNAEEGECDQELISLWPRPCSMGIYCHCCFALGEVKSGWASSSSSSCLNLKQEGNIMKFQAAVIHEKKSAWGNRKVTEEKLQLYFFLSVTYGNECRQIGTMNGAWWRLREAASRCPSGTYSTPTEEVVKPGSERKLLSINLILGPAGQTCLFKAIVEMEPRPQMEAIRQVVLLAIEEWRVAVSDISFHPLRPWHSVTTRLWQQNGFSFPFFLSLPTTLFAPVDTLVGTGVIGCFSEDVRVADRYCIGHQGCCDSRSLW